MFNKQIIYDLLEERGILHKELLEYLGKNYNGSLKQILDGDIKASNLEKMADFFGVSIDTFFDRTSSNNGIMVGGVGNKVHHLSVNSALNKEKENLEALIEEKDKRIKILEDMIELLKVQIPR